MANDAWLFLDALLCGMVIAVIYDILRIYRNVIPHLNILIGIEDFIFWNLAGIYVFAVMFGKNDGVVRGFFFVGTIIGAYIYKKSVGELLVKYSSKGINFIINIILKKPINKVIMIIRKLKEKADGKRSKKKQEGRENKSHKPKKTIE